VFRTHKSARWRGRGCSQYLGKCLDADHDGVFGIGDASWLTGILGVVSALRALHGVAGLASALLHHHGGDQVLEFRDAKLCGILPDQRLVALYILTDRHKVVAAFAGIKALR